MDEKDLPKGVIPNHGYLYKKITHDKQTRNYSLGKIDELTIEELEKQIDLIKFNLKNGIQIPYKRNSDGNKNQEKGLTLKQFFKEAIDHFTNTKKLSLLTIDQYKRHLKKFMEYVGENKTLISITTKQAYKFYDKIAKNDLSNSTLNNYRISLVTLFNLAIKKGELPRNYHNPFMDIDRLKADIRERVITEEEEEIMYMNSINSYMFDLLLLAFNTGLREKNLFDLTWKENVNWKKEAFYVVHLKSKARRFVFWNSNLKKFMLVLYKKNGHQKYVLLQSEGGKIASRSTITEPFKKVKKGIENNDDIVFHSIRHTIYTRFLEQNISSDLASFIIGHTLPTQLARTYGHPNKNFFEEMETLTRYNCKFLNKYLNSL